MDRFGTGLQVIGLATTGVGVISGFMSHTGEFMMLLLGIGGFGVFWIGTAMRRQAASGEEEA